MTNSELQEEYSYNFTLPLVLLVSGLFSKLIGIIVVIASADERGTPPSALKMTVLFSGVSFFLISLALAISAVCCLRLSRTSQESSGPRIAYAIVGGLLMIVAAYLGASS